LYLKSVTLSIVKNEPCQKIYSIKPGITGLASLYFHNEEMLLSRDKESAEDTFKNMIMPKKAAFELWYVDNRKFFMDLKIIIATLLVVCIPRYNVLSFISKRLGGLEVRQNAEKVLEMQNELNNKDANVLVK